MTTAFTDDGFEAPPSPGVAAGCAADPSGSVWDASPRTSYLRCPTRTRAPRGAPGHRAGGGRPARRVELVARSGGATISSVSHIPQSI